jgi:hypothetical protein
MLLVIVMLFVATLLMGTIVEGVLRGRRQLRQEQRRLQAHWLADAGLRRAHHKLRTTPDYGGDAWRVSGPDASGEAEIVTTVTGPSDAKQMTVVVDYPLGSPARVRVRRQTLVSLSLEPRTVSALLPENITP